MLGEEVGNEEDVHGACYHLGGRLDTERVTSGKSISKGGCAVLQGSQTGIDPLSSGAWIRVH